MSGQTPQIRDTEIDEILEQVQQKRGDARPVQSTDAELDAILAELGVSSAPKRAAAEPVLLPENTFARFGRETASQTAPEQPAGSGRQVAPTGQGTPGLPAGSPQHTGPGQQAAPARQAARPGRGSSVPPSPVGQSANTRQAARAQQPLSGQPSATAEQAPHAGQAAPGAAVPAQSAGGAAASETAAAPQAEKPTVELPSIKAYSQTEARKREEVRRLLLEQGRREAEQKLQNAAQGPRTGGERCMQSGAAEPGAAEQAMLPERAPGKAPAVPPARPENAFAQTDAPAAERAVAHGQAPAVTGNNLFGEVDDRFRDFFSSSVIDDPLPHDGGQRKKEKGGLWAKLFARRDDADADPDADDFAQGGAGEYYESAQEDGFSEAFDAIRRGQGSADAPAQPDADSTDAAPTALWTDPGTPLSASIVARAITGTDSFSFGATRSEHGFAVDVDLPLSGDGTGEYEKQRGGGDALSPEEDLEEYSNLSDAPMVAGELAAMRQTRMVRTVFTGALALFLVYLGLSARIEGRCWP